MRGPFLAERHSWPLFFVPIVRRLLQRAMGPLLLSIFGRRVVLVLMGGYLARIPTDSYCWACATSTASASWSGGALVAAMRKGALDQVAGTMFIDAVLSWM